MKENRHLKMLGVRKDPNIEVTPSSPGATSSPAASSRRRPSGIGCRPSPRCSITCATRTP